MTETVARPAEVRRPVADLPSVVYIMGAGRSGSTVLGILLGSLPGVFYGGELMAWNHFRGVPITERPDVQEFWQAVADHVPERELHHQTDFLPLLEHHRALLHPGRRRDRVLRRHYERQNRELFRAIRAVCGCDVLVDSSHFPLRVAALRRIAGLDLAVVHLVRDPCDVVASLGKPVQRHRPMHPAQGNVYCWVVALLSALVLRTVPADRQLVIRYEDLTRDPAASLERLGAFVGVAVEGVDLANLPVGPVFQANRVRHERRIGLDADAHPPPQLSRRWRRLTFLLQGPVRWHYGYLAFGPAPGTRRRFS